MGGNDRFHHRFAYWPIRGGDNMKTFIELKLNGQWYEVDNFDSPTCPPRPRPRPDCKETRRQKCQVCNGDVYQELLTWCESANLLRPGLVPIYWPCHNECYYLLDETLAREYQETHSDNWPIESGSGWGDVGSVFFGGAK